MSDRKEKRNNKRNLRRGIVSYNYHIKSGEIKISPPIKLENLKDYASTAFAVRSPLFCVLDERRVRRDDCFVFPFA